MSEPQLYLVEGFGGEYEEEYQAALVAVYGVESAKAIKDEFEADKRAAGEKYGIDADLIDDIKVFFVQDVPGGFVNSSRMCERLVG